jgi:hypothetical protein
MKAASSAAMNRDAVFAELLEIEFMLDVLRGAIRISS